MPREKKPVPPPDDVPMWFMTYSDVITLMMTFFILLLTFATNEPERFEKMKITMFGASGSSGLAGEKSDGIDKDSWSMRIRPRSARKTDRGTELPPVDKDAGLGDVDEGLKGLEEEEHRNLVDEYAIEFSGHEFASKEGELFSYGIVNLNMMASLLKQKDFELTFVFSDSSQMARVVAFSDYLISSQAIPFKRIGLNLAPSGTVAQGIVMAKFKDYQVEQNGETQTE